MRDCSEERITVPFCTVWDQQPRFLSGGIELPAVTVSFLKAVLTALMDTAMGGDLASIRWLEKRAYAAQFEPVRRSSTKDESDVAGS